MNFFKADHIVKQFNNHLALDRVSMEVPQGSIYGLLGPNGAGKTTLIRIINRITAPDSGKIFFRGRELSASDIFEIGYLPEERGLYKKMKVGEHAIYLARLKGLSKRDAAERLKYWFDKLEISGWGNKKIQELSKGMQQKIQFIVTVLHSPKLMIFDEPFSGFDPINADLLKKEVLKLRDQGATIIFSTHDMGSVEELCDHITLIDKGRTILQGEINEVRNTYKSDIYAVSFQGDISDVKRVLNHRYEISEHRRYEGNQHVRIRIKEGSDGNRLLSELIPVVRITSFTEEVPRMNDIFIRAVRENIPSNQQGPAGGTGNGAGRKPDNNTM